MKFISNGRLVSIPSLLSCLELSAGAHGWSFPVHEYRVLTILSGGSDSDYGLVDFVRFGCDL